MSDRDPYASISTGSVLGDIAMANCLNNEIVNLLARRQLEQLITESDAKEVLYQGADITWATVTAWLIAKTDAPHQEPPAIVHDGIEFHELRPTRSVGLWGRLRSFEGAP